MPSDLIERPLQLRNEPLRNLNAGERRIVIDNRLDVAVGRSSWDNRFAAHRLGREAPPFRARVRSRST